MTARVGLGYKIKFVVVLGLLIFACGTAFADNPYDMFDNPNISASINQQRINDIVDKCDGIFQRMSNRVHAQRDKVYYYAHDYNVKDGYILNSPLQIYVRDVREEMVRAQREFHKMYHDDGINLAACVNLAEKYKLRFDCYYEHTTKNDVLGMQQCSDLYEYYVVPYRYYGGK